MIAHEITLAHRAAAAPAQRPALALSTPNTLAGPTTPACILSDGLFAGAQEVQIDHHGMRYRLKKTALGKLILTK